METMNIIKVLCTEPVILHSFIMKEITKEEITKAHKKFIEEIEKVVERKLLIEEEKKYLFTYHFEGGEDVELYLKWSVHTHS